MARPHRIKEIGGQLVFDRTWHCSFCGRPYRGKRAHKMRVWHVSRSTRGALMYAPHVLNLCVTDGTVTGCYEMGLSQLFKRGK